MSHQPQLIQEDFDRLAEVVGEGWNHNNHYHDYLLRYAPSPRTKALDIGCGTGTFARLLAQQAEQVLAVDLSPKMVCKAEELSTEFPGIQYQVADIMTYPLPPEEFDCISSIATLHHLPLETVFSKIKAALKPGGVLLVLDLYKLQGFLEYSSQVVALPANLLLSWLNGGHVKHTPEAQAAWALHSRNDHHLPLSEIRRISQAILPGAQIRRHLLWRYSLIWKKPTG